MERELEEGTANQMVPTEDENKFTFTTSIEKSTHGLGLEIVNTVDGGTMIDKLKAMPDGIINPASFCDPPIQHGDVIIAVNGQRSDEFTKTVQYIRAAEGTVNLTILRDISILGNDEHMETRETNDHDEHHEEIIEERPRELRRTLTKGKSISAILSENTDRLRNMDVNNLLQQSLEKNNIGDLRASRFKRWKHEELVDLLISQGVELRGEEFIPISTLRGLCDNMYPAHIQMPQKVPELTDEEYEKYSAAALLIQNRFIARQALRRYHSQLEEEQKSNELIKSMGYLDSNIDVNVYEAEREMMLEREERKEETKEETKNDNETGDIEMGNVSNTNSTNELIPKENTADKKDEVKKEMTVSTWVKPTTERAEEYLNFRHPRRYIGYPEKYDMHSTTGRHCCVGGFGEQCDLFGEGQVSEFAQYGPGITNYFKFLKWNIWIFFILSIFSLPIIIFNYFGPAEVPIGVTQLSRTTAANVVSFTNTTEDIPIPGCGGYDYNGISCKVTPEELASMYSWIDFGMICFLMIAYLWLRIFERKESAILNKNTVTVSEFSVKITNLPKVCTTAELKAHLAKVTKHAVADVHFAYNNHAEIKAYRQRGLLIKERVRAMQEEKYYEYLKSERKQYIVDEAKLFKKLKEKKLDVGRKIKKIETDLVTPEDADVPICAFVTFEERIGAIACKAVYTTSMWDYYYMPQQKRFKDARLQIEDAQEPSTILWENLNFSQWDRRKRRMRTAIIAAMFIFVSLVARLTSTVLERSAQRFAGDSLCPANWNQLTKSEQQAQAEANEEILHCYCDELDYQERESDDICHDYFVQQVKANIITYCASFTVVVINMLLDWAVELFAGYEKHTSIDTRGLSVFIRLFWLYVVNTGIVFVIQINASKLDFVTQWTGIKPSPMIVNFSPEWYRIIAVSIILVQLGMPLSNQGYYVWQYFTHKANIRRAEINEMVALTQDALNNIFLGPHFKLPNRYAINTSIFFVCFIFSLGIPILNMIAFVNFYIVYMVDKFLFINYYRSPVRYDTKICESATRFIPLAVVAHLICSIWTLSNGDIFSSTDESNVVTNQGGQAASDSNNGVIMNVWEACTKQQTLPLFALLIFVLLCLIAEYTATIFYGSVGQLFVQIFGNVCSKWSYLSEMKKFYEEHKQRKNLITYSRAVQRGIIKGLNNYNILQNPHYQENFAISNKFAAEHNTLKSMKFTKTEPTKKTVNIAKYKKKQEKKQEKKPEPVKKPPPKQKIERISSDMQRELLLARELGEDNSNRRMYDPMQ
eukprot:TRINITY_DN65344_c0_g1_i1.p1 TRINITY_DN65344_c0_g1~~TRINITY_DN65344_c0_g1_i1.p1  ORF type:complete len:1271 (-),score=14.60 TRINITY_DN65344_c0_g1_i1:160-3972(-)